MVIRMFWEDEEKFVKWASRAQEWFPGYVHRGEDEEDGFFVQISKVDKVSSGVGCKTIYILHKQDSKERQFVPDDWHVAE